MVTVPSENFHRFCHCYLKLTKLFRRFLKKLKVFFALVKSGHNSPEMLVELRMLQGAGQTLVIGPSVDWLYC